MSNPYETPQYDPYQYSPAGQGKPSNIVPSSLVQQVRILGILNAVQGGLELIMALFFLFYAVFLPIMMNTPEFREGQPDSPPPGFVLGMGIGLGVVGALLLVVAVCRIVSGVRCWWFRSRSLAMVSMILGAVSIFTCYCAPTSLAVLVYGLIVMLAPPVKQAFEMAASGMPPEQILHEFSPYGPNSTNAL